MINLIFVLAFSFFNISLMFGQCALPTNLPTNPWDLENVNKCIARTFAPGIHQLAEGELVNSLGGRSDLITAIDYDGNMNTTDNWESVANFTANQLMPKVYYSVIWAEDYWIVTYAFYHPRDYAGAEDACCNGVTILLNGFPVKVLTGDNHENDMEGAVLVVSRTSNSVISAATISHHDVKVYLGLTESPQIYIDNRTHAVEANIGFDCIDGVNPCDDCTDFWNNNHVEYTYNSNVQSMDVTPNDGGLLVGAGTYSLEDIFSSDPNSLSNQRNNSNVFVANGTKFARAGTTDCQHLGGLASAPWAWSQLLYENSEMQKLLCVSHQQIAYTTKGSSISNAFGPLLNLANCSKGNSLFQILHNPYFPVSCSQNMTYYVNDDQEWNPPAGAVIDNVSIAEGVTLTISDKYIEMTDNARILLRDDSKLILDNSIISACNEKWSGIISQGSGSQIDMINESEIAHADNGITSLGNVDINCINSGFESCNVGMYIGLQNGSAVIEEVSWFRNCDVGISTVYAYDISIHHTQFSNNRIGLELFNSRNINLKGSNYISGGDYGVVVRSTYPLASDIKIGDMNKVSNNFTGSTMKPILASGTESPNGITVLNNVFNHSVGSEFIGANDVTFSNNGLYDSNFGTNFLATGNNENTLNCNKYYNNEFVDNYINGYNPKIQFQENEFINGNTNFLIINATIPDDIGTQANPAGNCFSSSNADIQLWNFWGGVTNPFVYHHFDEVGIDPMDACQIPISPVGYTLDDTDQEPSNCGGHVGIFSLIDPNGDQALGIPSNYDPSGACKPCVLDSISHWTDVVVSQGGDDPQTLEEESQYAPHKDLFTSELILDQWINFGIYISLEEADYNYGTTVLAPLKKWKWQKRLFGLKMTEKDFEGASVFLNTMPTDNVDQDYFKDIQLINLKVLMGYPDGELITEEDVSYLKFMAEQIQPSSGYAHSLYHQLTGVILSPDYPDPDEYINESDGDQEENEDEESEDEEFNMSFLKENTQISIFPNPTKELLDIQIDGPEIVSIQILRIDGVKVYHTEVEKLDRFKVDVSNYDAGLYLVRIVDASQRIHLKKVVIQ